MSGAGSQGEEVPRSEDSTRRLNPWIKAGLWLLVVCLVGAFVGGLLFYWFIIEFMKAYGSP